MIVMKLNTVCSDHNEEQTECCAETEEVCKFIKCGNETSKHKLAYM